jgi:hypothetical protein
LKKLRLRDLSDAAFIWFPRRESPAYYDRLMHASADSQRQGSSETLGGLDQTGVPHSTMDSRGFCLAATPPDGYGLARREKANSYQATLARLERVHVIGDLAIDRGGCENLGQERQPSRVRWNVPREHPRSPSRFPRHLLP